MVLDSKCPVPVRYDSADYGCVDKQVLSKNLSPFNPRLTIIHSIYVLHCKHLHFLLTLQVLREAIFAAVAYSGFLN